MPCCEEWRRRHARRGRRRRAAPSRPRPTTRRTRICRRSRSDGNDPKPTLDEMIEATAKLPPGPEAWEPIFEAYPEVTPEELIEKFRQSAERAQREEDQLRPMPGSAGAGILE